MKIQKKIFAFILTAMVLSNINSKMPFASPFNHDSPIIEHEIFIEMPDNSQESLDEDEQMEHNEELDEDDVPDLAQNEVFDEDNEDDEDEEKEELSSENHVDLIDLSDIIDMFGFTCETPGWDTKYINYDFNDYGIIDIRNIAYLASLISNF